MAHLLALYRASLKNSQSEFLPGKLFCLPPPRKREPMIAAARVDNELNAYSSEHMLFVSGRYT